MNRALGFCVFFLLSTSFMAQAEIVDNQEHLKLAFENSKKFHINKVKTALKSGPLLETRNEASSSFLSIFERTDLIVSATSAWSRAQDYIKTDVLQKYGISDFAKRAWRIAQGIKSIPPTLTTFLYLNNTAGSMPEVFLIASGATDPDGTIDRMEFTFGDGTSQVIPWADFETTSRLVSHLYPSAGTYAASLKIVDNTGDHATFNLSVVVSSTNIAPVPKFTLQYNQAPNFLKVDFTSQATDANGTLIRYTWRFGDASADVAGPTNTTATRTYSAAGIYTARLQVRDNQQAQTSASTNIHVGVPSPGIAPLGYVNANTFAGSGPLTVNFDGTKSFDIDGTIASYEWNFGDYDSPLNFSTAAQPSYKYRYPGSYYGSLKLTDNAGLTSIRYFSVYVLPTGSPENSQIIAYPTGSARTLTFESGYKAIKRAVSPSYQVWDFGDGSAKVKQVYPTHTYASNGTYTVTLKVYDMRGGIQTITKNVTVGTTMTPPPSYFLSDTQNAKENESISFTTQNSGNVISTTSAVWDFGDGSTQAGLHQSLLNVNHTYTAAGLYPVTLTVTDVNGLSSQSTTFISVQATTQPAMAEITFFPEFGIIPFGSKVDGKKSKSTAGPISQYHWSVYFDGDLYNFEGSLLNHDFDVAGEAIYTLTVKDSVGNFAIDTRRLTAIDEAAIPPANLPPVGNISISYPIPNDAETFKFSGIGSTDPDGDYIAEYRWNLNGTDLGSGSDWTTTIQDNGQHTITLKVTDKWGASTEVKKVFTKTNTSNFMLGFISSPDRPILGKKVFFLADEETVLIPGTSPKEFKWDFGDGSTDCCYNRTVHIYDSPGTYAVKLTIKDRNNALHVVTQNVVIEAIAAPTIKITAEDIMDISEITSPANFNWFEFPIEVKFNLNQSSVQGLGLVDANWNFGDGNTGFGLNPHYTFQKPGTYTVQVTATDSQGQSNTDSMDITVGSENCSDTDGINGCLKLNNSQGNVLPMSATDWPIGHDAGTQDWDPAVSDTEFAVLESEDEGTATSHNITSAIVVNGQELEIQKADLITMGVDFTRPYRLIIQTTLDDTTEYAGMFPKLYFGIGTANFTMNEADIRLTVTGTKGYKKYVNLGSNTTHQFADLPVDEYSVYAQKGNRTLSQSFTIANATPQSVTVDLSSANIRKRNAQQKAISQQQRENAKDSPMAKAFHHNLKNPPISMVPSPKAEYPWWAFDSCGNRAPYPLTVAKPIPEGYVHEMSFGSWAPDERAEYFRVPKSFGPEMKLKCSIWADTAIYELQKWVHVDGPKRCGLLDQPNAYWGIFLDKHREEMKRKIRFEYTIRDKMTGHETKSIIDSNLAQVMASQGIAVENITSKVGIKPDGVPNLLPGFKYNTDLAIPANYKRPEASIKLIGDFGIGYVDHAIGCAFEKKVTKFPTVSELGEDETDVSTMYSPSFNGKIFLARKLIPGDVDNNTSYSLNSPTSVAPNIYKARFKVTIDNSDYVTSDTTGVKLTFMRSGVVAGQYEVDFDPGSIVELPAVNKFKASITLDANQFDSFFDYVPNEDEKIEIGIAPIGEGYPTQQTGTLFSFSPLWDVLKINQNNTPGSGVVCKNGFYGTNISAFARAPLIDTMKKLTDTNNVQFRCNDFSLPWGGPFTLPAGWSHKGHDTGMMADVRYFNTDYLAQDGYDYYPPETTDQERKKDVDVYLRFSAEAKEIAESTILEPAWTSKEDLFESCTVGPGRPYAPCTVGTTINDLTHDYVLQLCQLYQNIDGTPLNGCPTSIAGTTNYLMNIKRVSSWLTFNVDRIKATVARTPIKMSNGLIGLITISPPGLGVSVLWQQSLLDNGNWPDGRQVYKYDATSSGLIGLYPSSCQSVGCGLGKYFSKDKDHFNHIHLGN